MKYPIQKWKRFRRKRKKKKGDKSDKQIPRTVIPSFFTLMNLFCGFLAIISVAEGRLFFGAWLIVFAGLFDALDGFMARLSNATSQFGIELDSISDVVSFGVAPGFLLYKFGLDEMLFAGIILSALTPICGAVRLARYNVDVQESRDDFFKGLPTPGQAIMIASFYLTFYDRLEMFEIFEYGLNTVLVPLIILLSFLMVSTIPFDKIPSFEKEAIKKHKGKFTLFIFYGILIVIFQEVGLMIVFSAFILKAIILGAYFFWKEIFDDDFLEESH
ncbi:CDP-diacylglycerol--serine O-phosphatidyltransferase [Fodinibius salinus]|uniref:CDP-diacylglycerol--serine O-phosphatidyltransferase n=1 Tax=Fodinibius salinus TaxID=860790 RepID=A0A5D3YN26_9BACT|nr:CDP-diacylglycerol--serine O-phosphatidyltransferase [Fodinibius salinus]TYP95102.1 CDP-diacylglycerol--serine O-phosphatidyltransferase [Fodinibius salinus]